MNSDYKQFGPPNPTYLAVHAATGNILHLTGRGKPVEKLMRDMGDNSALLAHDGITVLFCRLANFRVLPLVEMQNDEDPLVKPRAIAPKATMPGNENTNSRSFTSDYPYE